MPPEPAWSVRIALPDEAATVHLGRALAARLRPGDTIGLSGGLGAGKTTLARAIIRALAIDPALEAPSPTFTLVQPYDETAIPVRHFDLYRIRGAGDLAELGFDEGADADVRLVEWPERAPGMLGPGALAVALEFEKGSRVAVFSGASGWRQRLAGLPGV